jgi:hypothetical protein
MENQSYVEWERLCDELSIAQGEYMEMHGILVRKATGEDGFRGGPTTGDFERAKEAKARVETLQKRLDEFLKRHIDVAS